jgi:isocitrate dehydrogenase kinase/phosphatase
MKGVVSQVSAILGERLRDNPMWFEMKAEYSMLIACCSDYDLAETFFNSVTRRIFSTVGVDREREFVDSDFEPRPPQPGDSIFQRYLLTEAVTPESLATVIGQILIAHPFQVGYRDAERDALAVASEICQHLLPQPACAAIQSVDMIQPVFYRSKGAYLVGRLAVGAGQRTRYLPLVLCLLNEGQGVYVDAVLVDEDEASIIFSFTRSYFHVAIERPHKLVDFLKTILPLKRRSELYISIGYNKHGKPNCTAS